MGKESSQSETVFKPTTTVDNWSLNSQIGGGKHQPRAREQRYLSTYIQQPSLSAIQGMLISTHSGLQRTSAKWIPKVKLPAKLTVLGIWNPFNKHKNGKKIWEYKQNSNSIYYSDYNMWFNNTLYITWWIDLKTRLNEN